jgi:hypothetical protein
MTGRIAKFALRRDAFPAEALHRLALQLIKGDVVFFIGSGFSIDSEGNTATRLMRRLLVRLWAMTEVLGDAGKAIRNDLASTFGISGKNRGRFPYSTADVRRLSDRYYETNDWFCTAFGHLLSIWADRCPSSSDRPEFAASIAAEEEKIKLDQFDHVPLDKIDVDFLLDLVRPIPPQELPSQEMLREAGKALFLETMGFQNADIMGGNPYDRIPGDMLSSYGERLLPRHHVIARLAREGFCTTTITTNYDLLLEGAFRTAGFDHSRFEKSSLSNWKGLSEVFSPETYFKDFVCIASPREFFTEGKAHRTAVIMKIHGDSRSYRDSRLEGARRFLTYLRSMVFTYREIQNWREDSWAADCLRTLLRTKTVVFCGYSLQDPVIHDTFRTVYEEMAHARRTDDLGLGVPSAPEQAPAFFFAPGRDKNEFYGMEVLRAASGAVGAHLRFSRHPNYVPFNLPGEPGFPHLDELFLWLFHAVFRFRQTECLKNELQGVVTLMLGRPCPEAELAQVRLQFDKQWDWEQGQAEGWDSSAASRQEHAALCGWTDGFHNGLLREFACAEEVSKVRGQSRNLRWMRRMPWYYPTMNRGVWTCWGAVLELALRRMIESALLKSDEPPIDHRLVTGAACLQPTILFPMRGQGSQALQGLTIEVAGVDRPGYQPRLHGQAVRRTFWELTAGDAPWPLPPRSKSSRNRGYNAPAKTSGLHDAGRTTSSEWLPLGRNSQRAPDAGVIWRWASDTTTRKDKEEVRLLLAI